MSHRADVWEACSTSSHASFEGLLANGWEPYAVTTRQLIEHLETTWHLRRKTGRRVRIGDD